MRLNLSYDASLEVRSLCR